MPDIKPLSDILLVNIFFHFIGCIFLFLIMSFDEQKFVILMKLNLFVSFAILVSY